MDLQTYVQKKGGTGTRQCPVLASLAAGVDCSPATLYMINKGHKRAGHKLVRKLEDATANQVCRHDLRPDIFGPAPQRPVDQAAIDPPKAKGASGQMHERVDVRAGVPD